MANLGNLLMSLGIEMDNNTASEAESTLDKLIKKINKVGLTQEEKLKRSIEAARLLGATEEQIQQGVAQLEKMRAERVHKNAEARKREVAKQRAVEEKAILRQLQLEDKLAAQRRKAADEQQRAMDRWLSRINGMQGRELDTRFAGYIENLTARKNPGSAAYWRGIEAQYLARINGETPQQRMQKYDSDARFASYIQSLTAQKNPEGAAYWREQERLSNEKILAQQQAHNKLLQMRSGIMSQLINAARSYVSIWGAVSFAKRMAEITGEFEKQRVSLAAIIKDTAKANEIFGQVTALAVKSPFNIKEMISYTKQLSAFSIPTDELFETTKMLADVSAGLGVDMNRLVLAYGQIRSASFLRGQEVRQLTEAGIPILEDLAKQFEQIEGRAVSVGEVFDKISSRQVSFAMVEKVFKNMTSEGGKFYQMQEIQSQTLAGRISNLRDAYELMLADMGKGSGLITSTIDGLYGLIDNWKIVGSIILGLVTTYGIYNAVLNVAVLRQGELAAAEALHGKTLASLVAKVKDMISAMSKFKYGNTLAILAGLAVAIYKIARAANEVKREIQSAISDSIKNAQDLEASFLRLVESLKGAIQGTKEYSDIVGQINQKYGDYLNNILTEADAYAQVAAQVDTVIASIREKKRVEAIAAAESKVDEEYAKDVQDRYMDKILPIAQEKGVTKDALREFINNVIKSSAYSSLTNPNYIHTINNKNEFLDSVRGMMKNAGNPLYALRDDAIASLRISNYLYKLAEQERERAKARARVNEVYYAQYGMDGADLDRRREEANKKLKEANKTADKTIVGEDEREEAYKKNRIEWLNTMIELNEEYKLSVIELRKELDSLTNEGNGWYVKAKKIAKEAYKADKITIDVSEEKSLPDLLDEWSKAYKDIKKNIKIFGDAGEDTSRYEAQLSWYNKLSKTLGFGEGFEKYLDDAGKKHDKDSATNMRIKALEKEANLLKKVKDMYDKYIEAGMTDKQARAALASFIDFKNLKGASVNADFTSMADFIAEREKFVPNAYKAKLKDGSYEKVYTIGYGHRDESIKAGDTITQEEAVALLHEDIDKRMAGMKSVIDKYTFEFEEMNEKMTTALMSFAFNTGSNGETVNRLFSKAIDNATGKVDTNLLLENWLETSITSKDTGEIVDGLITRRALEAALFAEGLEEQLAAKAMEDTSKATEEAEEKLIDFDNVMKAIISRLKSFGTEGKEAAEKVKDMFDKHEMAGNASDYLDAYKLLQKVQEKMDEIVNEDRNIVGSGFLYDTSKILSDYNNRNAAFAKKASGVTDIIDAIKRSSPGVAEILKSTFPEIWEEYVEYGLDAVNKIAEEERDANKVTAREKALDAVRSYARESLKDFGLDKLNYMTLAQVRAAMKEVDKAMKKGMASSRIVDVRRAAKLSGATPVSYYPGGVNWFKERGDLSEDELAIVALIDLMEKLGLEANEIDEIFEKIFGPQRMKLANKEQELLNKKMKSYSGILGDIITATRNIGQTMGEEWISYLTDAMELAKNMFDTYTSFADAQKAITEEGEDFAESMANTADIISMAVKLVILLVEYWVKFLNKSRENYRQYAEYLKNLRELGELDYDTIFGTDSLNKMVYQLKEASAAAKDMIDILETSTKKDDKYLAASWIKDLKDGELSAQKIESLRHYIDDGTIGLKGNAEDRFLLLLDEYEEKSKAATDYIKSLFDGLADSLADNMLTSFMEIGDATANLEESFDSLGKTIAKSLLKSFLIETFLKKYQSKIAEAQERYANDGDYEALSSAFKNVTDEIKANLYGEKGMINTFMENVVKPLVGDLSNSSSLSSDIKGVTEDTASLLASYINAIRADVSVQRQAIQEMLPQLSNINENLNLGLVELKSINENTRLSAERAEGLLSIMRGARGEENSIKVYVVN